MTKILKKAISYGLHGYFNIYGKNLLKKCYYNKFIRKLEFLAEYGMPIISYDDKDVSVYIDYKNLRFSINYSYNIPNNIILIKSKDNNNYYISTTDINHIKKTFDKMLSQS